MKTRSYILMLALGCLAVMSVFAAQETTKPDTGQAEPVVATVKVNPPNPNADLLKTDMDKVSYIIGTQIARNFTSQDIEVNVDALTMGLKDALAKKPLAMSNEEMQKVYAGFQSQMRAKMAAKQAAEASKNLAAGKAFLEANKSKEGVKVLPSGLQYKVITEGTGKSPKATDKVKTNYRGTLIDGTEFDSSYKRGRPAEFPVNGVIKGWTEALQLMKEGSKWELYIPADLAYGTRPRPGIPANSTLIFEVELLEVLGQ